MKKLAIGLFGLGFSVLAQAGSESVKLFNEYKDSIYRIEIIHNETGAKSSYGTGFIVDKDGYVVTNHHVISSAVYEHEDYSIKYIREVDGKSGKAEIVRFNMGADIALIKMDGFDGKGKPISTDKYTPEVGETIVSFGNPQEAGLVFSTGYYNGHSNSDFSDKVKFNGTLDKGMSGGPNLSLSGNLVGVNVQLDTRATTLLVNPSHVRDLYEPCMNGQECAWSKDDFEGIIKDQAASFSQLVVDEFDRDWEITDFFGNKAPSSISKKFSCWSSVSSDSDDGEFTTAHTRCKNEDYMIEDSRVLGKLVLSSYGIKANEDFDPKAMLGKISKYYSFEDLHLRTVKNGTVHKDSETTIMNCHRSFITAMNNNWNMFVCKRDFTDFEGLGNFEVSLYPSSIEEIDTGYMLYGLGFTDEQIMKAIDVFMREMQKND